MSDKKTSSARFTASIDKFDGIDSGAKHKKPLGSSQIVNFRIDKNGSLKKRCGFKQIISAPDKIDGVWYGKLFGENRLIFVADSTVYEYASPEIRVIDHIDNLSNGEFSIFFYDGCLYFLNAQGIYRLNESGLSSIICYAPLIGKDWPSGWVGTEYEKRNLLSDYGRITYLVNESPIKYLRLNEKIEQVVSLYQNGLPLDKTQYSLDNENMAIHLADVSVGDKFELTVKYFKATDALSLDARSAALCSIFGGIEKNRPYLWGTADRNAIYVCKQLSDDQKSEAYKHIDCAPFYVTEDDIIKVGMGNYKVMALTKHLGRTLIFTEDDVWRSTEDVEAVLNSDEESASISDMTPISINTAIGAYVTNGVTLADNDPISIGKYSLFKWTSNTDELDEQNAYSISSEIDPLISDDFRAQSAIYFDKKRDEIYFYSRAADSKVWVWKKSSGKWVCFDGFTPTQFFEYEGETAFVSGNMICVFYDYLTQDETDYDVKNISARFTSNPIDFGNFEDKHMTALKASAVGGLIFELFYDGSDTPDSVFEAENIDHVISKRVFGKRFKYATLQITADGDIRQSIHSVELTAR